VIKLKAYGKIGSPKKEKFEPFHQASGFTQKPLTHRESVNKETQSSELSYCATGLRLAGRKQKEEGEKVVQSVRNRAIPQGG
jgi:hypothetical protein